MLDYDRSIKEVSRTAGRELAQIAGLVCQGWGPLDSALQATTERLADRAFLARSGGERFVVYMEFHTRWERAIPWKVLAKSGLLSETQRLPTRSLVYVLLPRGYRSQNGEMRLAVSGSPTQHVWFQEVPLWRQQPAPWWENVPGLMTLYPLCAHQRRPREAVQHAASVIEQRENSPVERADLLTILGVFGKLAYPRIDVQKLIGREKMKESKFYEEVMEEGRQEGREEGSLKTCRVAVLEVLAARFPGRVTPELTEAVNGINDRDHLERLLRLAATCKTLADFRLTSVGGSNNG